MAVGLALVTALTWGTMELLLIRAAKESGVLTLGLWLSIFGGLLTLPVALVVAPVPATGELAFALAPGLVGVAGALLYFVALREGKLSVVSPVVAASGGVAAVFAVFLLGETMAPLAAVAVAGSVLGVVLASAAGGSGATGAGWATASAIVLGAYAVILAISAERVGPLWAVVAYRAATVLVLTPIAALRGWSLTLPREVRRMVAGGAVLETMGFVALTYALELGPVAIVSVVMAQFSTVSVVLAATVLHDHLRAHQWAGVAIVLASILALGLLR